MTQTLDWAGFGGVTVWALLALVVAAAVAGTVDAVVGGGGLVQLPALILLLPGAPVLAVATNKVAAVVGTTAATVTYARTTPVAWRTALAMALAAGAGAVGGARLADRLPPTALLVVVFVAVVGVGTYTWRRPHVGTVDRPRGTARTRLVAMLLGGAVIGGYDGLAGPGTGSFLVFYLVAVVGTTFVPASATAKLVNVATNVGALAYFVPSGAVVWGVGLLMAAANLTGAVLGARLAVRRGAAFVRRVFLVVTVVLAVSLAVRLVGTLG